MYEKTDELFNWMDRLEEHVLSIKFSDDLLEQLPSYKIHPEGYGSVAYDDSYRGIWLTLEELGDMYWVYIRDYEIPSIKLLGEGVYEVSEETSAMVGSAEDAKDDPFPLPLLDLQNRIRSGNIDLDDALYGYYHDAPANAEEWLAPFPTYTSGEAAGKLGVSVARVAKMVDDRLLDGYRFGGKLLIAAESVDDRIDYIESHGKPTKGMTPKTMPSRPRTMRVDQTHACWDAAIDAHKGWCSTADAAKRVVEQTGMNPASAAYYVSAILALLDGGTIEHDVNTYSINYFLDRILAEFGEEALNVARKVCMRRFEETKQMGNTCHYYRRAAEKRRP